MSIVHALVLGVLQGLTEFLPVSSSGHLVLAEKLLNLHIDPRDMQAMNVLLHAGTLLALLLIYARTWITLLMSERRKLVLLVIATIPGACIGLLFEDAIAQYVQSLFYVGIAFAVTGIVLILGEVVQEPKKLTTRSAFVVGCAQALALVPGLSRSGLTISAGRLMGLDRSAALDFSFLMAVPIIAGATAITLIDVVAGTIVLPTLSITLTAVAMSFLASVFAIVFLRAFIVHRSLAWFSPYLFLLCALTIFFS